MNRAIPSFPCDYYLFPIDKMRHWIDPSGAVICILPVEVADEVNDALRGLQ